MNLASLTFLTYVLTITDGDTFRGRIEVWPNVEVVTAVRVSGIDTPEIRGKCVAEREKAITARERLRALLAAGEVTITKVMNDKFAGRVDAVVMVNGVRVADTLVAEGLARPYTGGARQGWCQ
jgi:endonuclease YncB( thermonuclease family)